MNNIIVKYGYTALVGSTIGSIYGLYIGSKPTYKYSTYNSVVRGMMIGYLYPITLPLLYNKKIMF